jgi:hypothetical protein
VGVEYIHDGVASGNLAARLLQCDMDPGALRPYVWSDGKTYIDKFVGNDDKGAPQYKPMRVNNDSVIPAELWRSIDQAVVEAARPELRVISDLQNAGLVRNVDAMSTVVLTHYRRQGQASSRVVMNPAVRARRDRSTYAPAHTPIPFIESEWGFELRDLRVAQRGGVNLDLDQIREATRSVMETAEDMVLGNVSAAFNFNGYTMPGILNFPDALTQVLTNPTGSWDPPNLYAEVNSMTEKSINNNFPGPWMLYFGYQWAPYLNEDYSTLYPGPNLREKLLTIEGISGIRILRRLPGYKVILMQMTENVFRLYNGMPLRAIQWESPDGFVVQGKIITSIVPQPRSDAAGQTGIVIGNVP